MSDSLPSRRLSAIALRSCRARTLVSVALLVGGACKKEEPKPQGRPAVDVSVVTVEPRDMPVAFEFVAQTASSHQVEIRARVAGFLEHRRYEEGSIVEQGSVLFEMDRRPFEAQVKAAKAALERHRAAHETARRNLERVKPLAAQNALSQKDLDDAIGAFETSAAAVEQGKAQLETAELDLSYCTIHSPLKGITGQALQHEGAYLNLQNSHLTTVFALSPMWIDFSVSENEMARHQARVQSGEIRVPEGNNFDVEVVLVDGTVFPSKGKITFVAPAFSSTTGTFLLRASVDNPDGTLRPNQFAHVRLSGAVRPKAMLIPQRATRQGSRGHFVFLVDRSGNAEVRPVTVGEWQGTDVFVTEGLQRGDRVIVDSDLTLRPGDPVRAKAWSPTPPSPERTAESHPTTRPK